MKITPAQARAWRRRWKVVAARQRKELRAMTPAEKLRQLGQLMGWVEDFGWGAALQAEEDDVRARWIRLRQVYGQKNRSR